MQGSSIKGRCDMGVASDAFAINTGLRSLTLANMDLWGFLDDSLRGLTALTRLDLGDARLGHVPSALADVRHTLKELSLLLNTEATLGWATDGLAIDKRATELLLSLGQLEKLKILKAGKGAVTAWSNAEVSRLLSFPAAFLGRHPERSLPPLLSCM